MLNDKVTRTAFLISFLVHCLFLGTPGINLDLLQPQIPENITVKIEIEKPSLLPKINVIREEKKLKEVTEEPKKIEPVHELQPEEVVIETQSKGPVEEEVEVTDPAIEAMLRYQDIVKQRIEAVKRYPSWAKEQGIEGTAYLSFIILSNGLSQDIQIIRSSGYKILDEEAIKTIKRASPFPPIPNQISLSSVRMELSIIFTLE